MIEESKIRKIIKEGKKEAMKEMSKNNLDLVKEMASDIKKLGFDEYLRLLSYALLQLSESAEKMNKREESERWEMRSLEVDGLTAWEINTFYSNQDATEEDCTDTSVTIRWKK